MNPSSEPPHTYAPAPRLAGRVTVESGAFVGIGATVIQHVRVGYEAVVGAGAVVISDVAPMSTVVGVPAREIKQGSPTIDAQAWMLPEPHQTSTAHTSSPRQNFIGPSDSVRTDQSRGREPTVSRACAIHDRRAPTVTHGRSSDTPADSQAVLLPLPGGTEGGALGERL